MSHIQINKDKNMKKWSPILEKMGVKDPAKQEWMAEYAQYHSINENTAYATLGNITGMGAVTSPQVSSTPGQTGTGTGVAGSAYGNGGVTGSGDYGQQLLPVAMKVAAHTIGLDLVAVKPTPGPVIDLMYVDYRYDDGPLNSSDYNPIVFKIKTDDTLITTLISQIKAVLAANNVRETQGGLTKRVFFNLSANSAGNTNPTISGAGTRTAGAVTDILVEPTNKEGAVEFLGFSRIDGYPMFKAYRTTNAANQGIWRFDRTKNTFGETEQVAEAFDLDNAVLNPLNTSNLQIGFSTSGATEVSLVSALEDHLPGFTTNGLQHGMPRDVDEQTYPGIIAPNVTTKRVQVGTVEVSSALKITEIEDIKAQTGIDIVQKLESVLVNELSQTISKEIVNKVFEMGELNRQSAPGFSGGTTIFDFDADTYFATNAPGGETTQSAQRKLITKIKNASNYIATEGRIGPASYIVTNGTLAAVLSEGSNYALQPEDATMNGNGQLYPMGKVAGMTIYVDPYMLYDDKRILLGRKNNPDQPGIIFVPYLMAQSINLISEATFAPRMLLRSRYAVTEVGFFPQKQYITVHVTDTNNVLA
jgi:hypothetical protein